MLRIIEKSTLSVCLGVIALTGIPTTTRADTTDYTPAATGFLGLNTIPNARMDVSGTVRTGISFADPYLHGYIGYQIATPLSVVLRQTAETSNPFKSPDALYPGLDIKLRLTEEGDTRPALVIGAQSAFGHKRTSGEYIALSKRYHNIDMTAGLGWGRFGTANHINNPMRLFGSHFRKNRDFNDQNANNPENWFTGEHIGLFGGLQYFTPLKGLSIKFDYGADRYTAEQNAFNFDSGSPWAIGASYTLNDFLSADIGFLGDDKIMARLSLQNTLKKWPTQNNALPAPKPFYKERRTDSNIEKMAKNGWLYDPSIGNITILEKTLLFDLYIPKGANTPQHLGRAIRNISTHASPNIEEFQITFHHAGIQGKTLSIIRRDFEKALWHSGSPQEIWKNSNFTAPKTTKIHTRETNETSAEEPLEPPPRILKKPFAARLTDQLTPPFELILDTQFSIAEEETGLLYRTSMIAQKEFRLFKGLHIGGGLRFNMSNNLFDTAAIRQTSPPEIRSDISDFAQTFMSIDTGHVGYTSKISTNTFAAATAGYLEEQFAGVGTEILYRPFKSRVALGIEAWRVQKREPDSHLHLRLENAPITTAFTNVWYELPKEDIVITAKAGRYLFGDLGTTLGFEKTFENGMNLSGNITLSNRQNPDAFGGTTNIDHTLRLSLPLNNLKNAPDGSLIRVKTAPFGRDMGQTLQREDNLYKKTTPLTLGQVYKDWKHITE